MTNNHLNIGKIILWFIHCSFVILVSLGWVTRHRFIYSFDWSGIADNKSLHITAGLLLLLMIAIRIICGILKMFFSSAGKPHYDLFRILNSLAIYAIYLLMIGVIATGVLIIFKWGKPLNVLNLFNIQSPYIRNSAEAMSTRSLHDQFANALIMMCGAHISIIAISYYANRRR